MTLNIEQLRKNKLMIATPMYGGQCAGMYMKSCLDLNSVLTQHGIEHRFTFLFNESLITRARAYLSDEFLRSGYTHLLFIDSDIEFNPMDVLALLHLDKDVNGALYPKKAIKWENVIQAIKNRPDIKSNELELVTGDFVFNPLPGVKQFSVAEPIEVLEIGTGFMMIKREVFLKFSEEFPHLKYKPDHVGQANFDGSREIHMFFDTVIDPDTGRYLSEDYFFCQSWRKIGGKIFVCPWMKTRHVGSYAFSGSLVKNAEYLGTL